MENGVGKLIEPPKMVSQPCHHGRRQAFLSAPCRRPGFFLNERLFAKLRYHQLTTINRGAAKRRVVARDNDWSFMRSYRLSGSGSFQYLLFFLMRLAKTGTGSVKEQVPITVILAGLRPILAFCHKN
jgi:hypothetical protein